VDINELTVQEQRGYRNNKRIGRNGYVRRSDNTGGFTGQGLISFIRSGTHRKTRDHDPQSQRRVRATRLAPIVRSIDRDGITSCQSRSSNRSPGHSSYGNSWWAAVLWCPTAYRSMGTSLATCPPLSKSRSNEIIRTSHVIFLLPTLFLPSVHAIK